MPRVKEAFSLEKSDYIPNISNCKIAIGKLLMIVLKFHEYFPL